MTLRALPAMDPAEPSDLEMLSAAALAWMGTVAEDDAATEARALLADAVERLAALEDDHYVHGLIPADRFRTLHGTLTSRVEALRSVAGHRPHTVDLAPLLDAVEGADAWGAAPPELRRAVLLSVVGHFTLKPAPARGSRWDASRLSLALKSAA